MSGAFGGSAFGGGAFGGDGGDSFLQQLLGDLLQFMGGAGGDRTELARALAQGVATGGQPEANVDPMERIRFEELARVAELHVTELTGLPVMANGAEVAIRTVGPGAWAWQTVEDWRFLLEAMAGSPTTAGSPTATSPTTASSSLTAMMGAVGGDSGDLMARFMATMGPMLAALQLGSAIGHLAKVTLGPYEVPVPRVADRLMLVPANVSAFAEAWALPLDEVRMWVCLREITMHAVLGRPHVAGRLRDLLVAALRAAAGDAAGLMEQLQHIDPADPEALQRMLGDPEALVGGDPSPERLRATAELSAVTTALAGYVEHMLDLTAARLLGGRGAMAEAWRRRQIERDSPSRTAEVLFGLDLGPAQVDVGTAFVDGVVERAGEGALSRLWASGAMLPTPAEISAPGLWLERTSFEAD